ncbi:MAG: hypothetical protein DRO39_06320 [Thermoprotei archaeon]|nr:MAG: hypothetical protein DRO39_06320 [Thermoprotei archaeon]
MSEEPIILKVWQRRGNRAISISKILPPTWRYVAAIVLERGKDHVVVRFEPVKIKQKDLSEESRTEKFI